MLAQNTNSTDHVYGPKQLNSALKLSSVLTICTRSAIYRILGMYFNCLCCLKIIITQTLQYFYRRRYTIVLIIQFSKTWTGLTRQYTTAPTTIALSAGIDAPTGTRGTSFWSVDIGMRTSRDRLANHGSERSEGSHSLPDRAGVRV